MANDNDAAMDPSAGSAGRPASPSRRDRTFPVEREHERHGAPNVYELAELLPELVCETGADGEVFFANSAFYTAFGYSREEQGVNLYSLIAAEERPRLRDALSSLRGTGRVHSAEYAALCSDQTRFPAHFRVALRRDIGGNESGYRAVITDLTERRKSKEVLDASISLLQTTFESSVTGIMVTDPGGVIELFNRRFAELFGGNAAFHAFGEESELTAYLLKHLIHPQAFLDAYYDARNRPDETHAHILEFKDGRVLKVSWQPCAKGKAVLGRIWNIDDITWQRRMEESFKCGQEKLERVIEEVISAMTTTATLRDPYTGGHQKRVAALARAIAGEMELSEARIKGITSAALLHDIGKINIPSEILSSPARLSDMEFNIIKTHARAGYDILRKIEFPWPVATAVYQHHERLDGSGYPLGLRETDLLLESRILSVADVVEAISSHRPYRPALGIAAALEEITRERGRRYDKAVVEACLRVLERGDFDFEAKDPDEEELK